ncbi:MAG TPA: hypothetical protein VII30_02105 [Gemmatimonadaceae bacterium]
MTQVPSVDADGTAGEGAVPDQSPGARQARATASKRSRRTPRTTLIVVLPENHFVSPSGLAERLPIANERDVDVIVACAGQPMNLHALQRTIADAQFLLAPAGTSMEDLRELAMRQAPGDIVTLLSGALMSQALTGKLDIKTS